MNLKCPECKNVFTEYEVEIKMREFLTVPSQISIFVTCPKCYYCLVSTDINIEHLKSPLTNDEK